jgi:2-keto-4-pentenoate hydratase/2-oxohepta-3-ene-1,7-dioic acid hydratase in catechol pathway
VSAGTAADECNGEDTQMKLWVNGELRQNVGTKSLIFNIPKLISVISQGITLYPGDLIATGTPVGVGLGFKPPKYLKAGDVVRIEIDGIGMLENTLI